MKAKLGKVVFLLLVFTVTFLAAPSRASNLLNPRINGNSFEADVDTETNMLYVLQSIPLVQETNWSTVTAVLGDGTRKILRDNEGATNILRFYRLSTVVWRRTVILGIGNGQDAFVSRGGEGTEERANENRGNDPLLIVGQTGTSGQRERSFVQFDLSAIPSNSIIESAFLTVTGVGGHGGISSTPIEGYRMLRSWVEGEITWERPAEGETWSGSGFRAYDNAGYHSADSQTGAPLFSGTLAKTGASTFELNAVQVQEWVNKAIPNYGMLLRCPIELNGETQIHFASSEESESSKRPILTITYTSSEEISSRAFKPKQ